MNNSTNNTNKSKQSLTDRANRYITEDMAADTLKTIWKTSVGVVTVFAMLATSSAE